MARPPTRIPPTFERATGAIWTGNRVCDDPQGGRALGMEGPSTADQLFLARPFVWMTRAVLAFPVTTIAICLALAGVACYLTATRLGYQTSRLDLLNPKSNY